MGIMKKSELESLYDYCIQEATEEFLLSGKNSLSFRESRGMLRGIGYVLGYGYDRMIADLDIAIEESKRKQLEEVI